MLRRDMGASRTLRGVAGAMLVLAVASADHTPASANWSETFAGGTPSNTWIWQQLNPDGSASGASPTYGPGTVSVSSTVPVFPDNGPLAFFGLVPVPFSNRVLMRSDVKSGGGTQIPVRDAGVLGMINTSTLDGYSATLDYPDGGGFDLSKISFGSPTNMRPQRDVPNFNSNASYVTELEVYGQSITGRVYDSAGVLLTSISAVDAAPYSAGLSGLAVSRPNDGEVVRSTFGTTSSQTPTTAQVWAADGTTLGGVGVFSASSPTFLANGAGTGGAWNPAVRGIFTADSEFFQDTDPSAPGYYPAYNVPNQIYVATVPVAGVNVSNGISFYANQYSIRWEDNGDPTFANFTSGNGLILSGSVDFNVAPDVIGTVSARLTGPGALVKSGPGILNLVNNFSSFTGDLVVNAGTVYAGANGYDNSGVSNTLGAFSSSRRIVVNAGGDLSFRAIEGMAEANSQSPAGAAGAPTLVANGGTISNGLMIEQDADDKPGDNWHYMGGYTAVGNVELNGGRMLGTATFWNDLWTYETPQAVTRDTWPGFQAFMLQGSVTSSGNSEMAMQASEQFRTEWNRVSGTGTGGDGLYTWNPSTGYHLTGITASTPFNVTSGTLTVSGNLLDAPAGEGPETPDGTRDSIRASFTKSGAGTMVISGSNWFTGTATVQAGVLRATTPGGNQPLQFATAAVQGGTLQLGAGPGGALDTPSLTMRGLDVQGGMATLPTVASSGTTAPSARMTVTADTLSVNASAGAMLDMGRGRILVAPGGISEAELRNDLIAGRGTGGFSVSGTGGIVTSGGVAGAAINPVVGYRELASGTSIVAWSAFGDANLDGQVNQTDINLILSGGKFGQGSSSNANWVQGDFNYSGGVTQVDINLLLGAGLFGQGSYLPVAPLALGGSTVAAVPEPGLGLAAGIGGLALLAGSAVRRRMKTG